MKNCSSKFKQEITLLGKQQDLKISYGNNDELTNENIISASIFYEGNILKSMMKSLELECDTEIAIGTELNIQYGLLVDDNYEYINLGKFYIYKVEKQEDTGNYIITCYDKMLNAMVNYDDIELNIDWSNVVTVGSYLIVLALAVGIEFDMSKPLFANSLRVIHSDLYKGLGYTVRDVFDEISAVAGGSLCINDDNKLEMRYPSAVSQYTIDENYLKDINVKFGQKYGPINSIVLSRSAESDNVFIQDEDSIRENGLCELKIIDNQIMNFNDRADYLQELFEKLNGLNYFINDYSSTGITFLDYMDKYTVAIDGNYYNCLMLNDEINVTQGLEELVHTKMPEETKTDYTKADKADRRIYLIVDKQNQKIESVVAEVDEQNDKISQIQQTTDNIELQVSNMYNATKTVTANKRVVLEKCIKGYLLKLRILGNNVVFDRLYPADDLYPADNLYPKGDSRIIVTDKDGNSQLYELRVPSVLRANSEVFDEYILENNYAKVIRRVNEDGTTKINEEIEVIGTYTIYLEQDENTIEIQNYDGIMEAVYVEQNGYTDQFATKIEMNSAINISEQSIVSTVNKKLSDDYSTTEEMNSIIEQTAEGITSQVSRTYATKSEMNSSISQTAESINTEVRKKVGNDEVISKINQSAEAVQINAGKISLNGKTINLGSDSIAIQSNNFNVDTNGNMSCTNADISGKITTNNATITGGYFSVNSDGNSSIDVHSSTNSSSQVLIYADGDGGGITLGGRVYNDIVLRGGNNRHITCQGYMEATAYNYVSDERLKENIIEFNKRAIDIIKKGKIYSYQFKESKNKEFGLVVGDNYECPDEVVVKGEKYYGISSYRMNAILWKAVQEQQEMIEQMRKEINELKGGN